MLGARHGRDANYDPAVRWKVHRERTLYRSDWVTLALADVELPSGVRFDHHLVRMPRAASAVVMVDADRRVLLLRRHRFITDTWGWEVPAGGIDEGESAAEAAVREAVEESGWRPGPLRALGRYFPSNGLCDQAFNVFLADGAEHVGDPTTPDEVERVEWLPLDDVPELAATGELNDGFSLTALLWALQALPARPRAST
jgi:8-oxo-dGTP pyrophosphatase MutT (NUDIX family)